MAPFITEWLNLLVRWVHVIAAIAWIGDSFLFMWLDSHLVPPTRPREGAVTGELWMCHSGGFYEVVKRKSLAKNELPATLHWFKWESYTTWMSGFLLLIVVYHTGNSALLIDPAVYPLKVSEALGLSLYLLPVGYLVYEGMWWLIGESNELFAVIGLGVLAGLAYFLTHVFSARGAFLQTGAMLGTIMAANVFFRIIPAQRHMLAATAAGTPVDTSYGLRAKGRSIHNHYLTLPVLFCMLSNHFPSVYGSRAPWLTLVVMVIFGAGLKYAMVRRKETPVPIAAVSLCALGGALWLSHPRADPAIEAYRGKPAVNFDQVSAIIATRCTACHAEHPAGGLFAAPPEGVMLDSPDRIRAHAGRIFVRAVSTKTMPLANITGITPHEREILGAWYAQGAHIPEDAAMPAPQVAQASTAALDDSAEAQPQGLPGANPQEKASKYFKAICASCHGFGGQGDGVAASALHPPPRNFTDRAWQAKVTDDHLREVISKGGAAMGLSALMPPQPLLAKDPDTLNEIVKLVRGFGAPAQVAAGAK